MNTTQKIINASATNMEKIEDNSVNLIVTSPPYPMIEMWDDIFSMQNEEVKNALENHDYIKAYEGMHFVLEKVWNEVDRVLAKNGIACINIGDATKNCDGKFQLFPNHSKIIEFFMNKGYSVLPDIIWRKQTNAPNKFMGSGMYPPGAYVTFEHEYILILRKGNKREFKSLKEKENRRKSAYFWEERNIWFSDVWDFKGKSQSLKLSKSRNRSGAYPFELAYRLINMYSVKGDTVLDPFLGTGTTLLATMASERNGIGIEIDEEFCKNMFPDLNNVKKSLNDYIDQRFKRHISFVNDQKFNGKNKFYLNENHEIDVKTRQEKKIIINKIEEIEKNENTYICSYNPLKINLQMNIADKIKK